MRHTIKHNNKNTYIYIYAVNIGYRSLPWPGQCDSVCSTYISSSCMHAYSIIIIMTIIYCCLHTPNQKWHHRIRITYENIVLCTHRVQACSAYAKHNHYIEIIIIINRLHCIWCITSLRLCHPEFASSSVAVAIFHRSILCACSMYIRKLYDVSTPIYACIFSPIYALAIRYTDLERFVN